MKYPDGRSVLFLMDGAGETVETGATGERIDLENGLKRSRVRAWTERVLEGYLQDSGSG